jgi:hypothetical protein
MIDLRSLQQQQQPRSWDTAADYNRLPTSSQRYGSLPRRSNQAADQYLDATSRRSNLYGSLPRNFERADLYDELYTLSQQQQQIPSTYTRSAAQLDRQYYPAYIDPAPVRRRPASYDDLTGRQYATDDYGATRRLDDYSDDMLLSQYANYVNTQINAAGFLDDPLMIPTSSAYPTSQAYSAGATYPTPAGQGYLAGYTGVATPDYTPPLADYTYADRVHQAQSQPVPSYVSDFAAEIPRASLAGQNAAYDVRNATYDVRNAAYDQRSTATYGPRMTTSMYDQRLPTYDQRLPDQRLPTYDQCLTDQRLPTYTQRPTYDARLPMYDQRLSLYDRLPSATTSGDYVYSRREQNYGTRPTQPIGNYGNYGYRTTRPGDPYSGSNYQRQSAWNTLPASMYTGDQRWDTSRNYQIQPTDYGQRSFDDRWPVGYGQEQQRQKASYLCSTQPKAQPQPYGQANQSAFLARCRERAANPLLLEGIPKKRG